MISNLLMFSSLFNLFSIEKMLVQAHLFQIGEGERIWRVSITPLKMESGMKYSPTQQSQKKIYYFFKRIKTHFLGQRYL